jgi:hypothetical protein
MGANGFKVQGRARNEQVVNASECARGWVKSASSRTVRPTLADDRTCHFATFVLCWLACHRSDSYGRNLTCLAIDFKLVQFSITMRCLQSFGDGSEVVSWYANI